MQKIVATFLAVSLSAVVLGNSAPALAQSSAPARIALNRAQVFARAKPFGFAFLRETNNGAVRLALGAHKSGNAVNTLQVTTLRGRTASIAITFVGDGAAAHDAPNNHLNDFKGISKALFPRWTDVPARLDADFERVVRTAGSDDAAGISIDAPNLSARLWSNGAADTPSYTLMFSDKTLSKALPAPADAAPAPAPASETQGLASAQPAPTAAPAAPPTAAPPPPSPAQGAERRSAVSVAPADEWNCPASHPFKGNRNSMIYHPPGGRSYNKTTPEECFASAEDAVAAGYRAPKR
jgi:hypothetical protein